MFNNSTLLSKSVIKNFNNAYNNNCKYLLINLYLPISQKSPICVSLHTQTAFPFFMSHLPPLWHLMSEHLSENSILNNLLKFITKF